MKTVLATLVVCAALVATTAGFQAGQTAPPTQAPPTTQTPPQDQKPPVPDVTLTGCLVQGSAPTVFIFDNARKDPKNPNEKALKFVAIAAAEDLDLRKNLNHEVQLTGQMEVKALPTGKVEEKDLPKFTAKSLTSLSDTCGVMNLKR